MMLRENWTLTSGRDLSELVRWAEVAEDAGIGPSGLPMGLQVIGRNHDDAGVIEFAAAWECETRFVEKHLPPLIAP